MWNDLGCGVVSWEDERSEDEELTSFFYPEVVMSRRGRMSRSHSRSNFRQASGVHPRNDVYRIGPSRGGNRL